MAAKKGVAPEDIINLKVLGQDNTIIRFKMKKNTPLMKLMKSYCEKTGLDMATARFRFDGEGINENDTPSSLNMENDDVIEIFQQQTGG